MKHSWLFHVTINGPLFIYNYPNKYKSRCKDFDKSAGLT